MAFRHITETNGKRRLLILIIRRAVYYINWVWPDRQPPVGSWITNGINYQAWKHLMFTGFETIVEERIRKAQQRGLFDNLAGAGKPLPKDVIGNTVAEDLRLSYRILKNADCLPPEMEVKKEIRLTEELLAGMHDTVERYRTMKKLNYLILKLNTMRKGSAALEVPQYYADRLLGRLEKDAPK